MPAFLDLGGSRKSRLGLSDVWKSLRRLRKALSSVLLLIYSSPLCLPFGSIHGRFPILYLQALMTGSIPGFIDIVMNLNSPELLEDNLIWQAKRAGKRIAFYGDDTWIKLFPKHFVEFDGTTSFFVSDFTEVRGWD